MYYFFAGREISQCKCVKGTKKAKAICHDYMVKKSHRFMEYNLKLSKKSFGNNKTICNFVADFYG